jgi:ACT domain-containing protein
MADMMRKVAYFTMDVPNKPGEAARLLGALADAGVNLLGFTGLPSGKKAQLDFIPEDVSAFKNAVKAVDIKTRPQKFGLLVQGEGPEGLRGRPL